jgi:hypothetical protein
MIENFKNWKKLNEESIDPSSLKCKLISEKKGVDEYDSLIATVVIDSENTPIEVRRYDNDYSKIEFIDIDGYHLVDLKNLQWWRHNTEEAYTALEEIEEYIEEDDSFVKSIDINPFDELGIGDLYYNEDNIKISDIKLGLSVPYTDYIFDCPCGNPPHVYNKAITFRFYEGMGWPELMVDEYIVPMSPDQDDMQDEYGSAFNEVVKNIGDDPNNIFSIYKTT